MKKTLLTLVACAGIALTPIQAQAGDDAAYLLGGILGGLVLGNAMNRHEHYSPPPAAYVIEESPEYVRICRNQWVNYYDPYGNYVRGQRRVCEWVPR